MTEIPEEATLALFEAIMGADPTTPACARFALLDAEDQQVFRIAINAVTPFIRQQALDLMLDDEILLVGYREIMNPEQGDTIMATFIRAVTTMVKLAKGANQ